MLHYNTHTIECYIASIVECFPPKDFLFEREISKLFGSVRYYQSSLALNAPHKKYLRIT